MSLKVGKERCYNCGYYNKELKSFCNYDLTETNANSYCLQHPDIIKNNPHLKSKPKPIDHDTEIIIRVKKGNKEVQEKVNARNLFMNKDPLRTLKWLIEDNEKEH